jgi:galactokinase
MSDHSERADALIAAYTEQYGAAPQGIAEAPGRVNLIGEHVDYNDGLVLPFAIDRSALCAWGPADDGDVRVWSHEYDGWDRFPSADVPGPGVVTIPPLLERRMGPMRVTEQAEAAAQWSDYVRGVVDVLVRTGHGIGGVRLGIAGDVPQGAGLSSSAALEVSVAGAMRDAFLLPIDDVALARLCQRAENEYVGVQSGIMDQFASVLSKRDHALLIDCRTLGYEHVPLRLDQHGLSVVIANSGVARELASSAYNERRHECETAVIELRQRLGRPELASLRDVTSAEVASVGIDTTPLRRARHVVGEIARVATAAEALRADDFVAFGELMGESHRSLRDDYAVSSEQLDLLVGLASAQEYVVGARLTGAGFGGCTVNIVRSDAIERFERDVMAAYRERTGLAAEVYVTAACDGLRSWRLED